MFVGCGRYGPGFKFPEGSFTHIHLDLVRVKFLSCIKKNKKKIIVGLLFLVKQMKNINKEIKGYIMIILGKKLLPFKLKENFAIIYT